MIIKNKYEKNPFNYCYLILYIDIDTHFDLCIFKYSGNTLEKLKRPVNVMIEW